MDGRRTCKGCGAVVVMPIVCNVCNVASHPACISRTGHPHLGGQFSDCNLSVGTQNDDGRGLMLEIKQLIREEFAAFRKEMSELYRVDMERIMGDIQCLSNRIDKLESAVNGSQAQVSGQSHAEEIIEELVDREKRSMNLIFLTWRGTRA